MCPSLQFTALSGRLVLGWWRVCDVCVSVCVRQFTALSGRLVPELVAFLQGVLYTAVPSERQPPLAAHVLLPHEPRPADSAGLLQLEHR